MPFLFIYLLKLSLSLAVVFTFYHLVLRKLTFHNWNRWYLLGYTLLCFFIPFIDISPVLQSNEWTSNTALSWVPVIEEYKTHEVLVTSSPGFFTAWTSTGLVVLAGMLIMFFRLTFQLISFRRMMKKAKAIPAENVNLFQVDEKIIPFSFGNSIFINQHLHTTEELQEIIRHEFVHVKQKHSIDIIWCELLCLVNWYNPFAWLLKKSIRQNLEFIADDKVLQNGIDKKQYQYLLLKVIGDNQFSIAPKFNFSSLKKRIAMMNKLKTAKLHLVRFLFILPLLAVILLSFRKQTGDSITKNKNKEKITAISAFTDTIPGELNEKGYIIDVTGRKSNAMVIVKDRNEKLVERISYNKWKDNEKFYNDKYGELPPPPPPPLPPTPPDPPQPMELPENVKKIDINDKKATVVLNDGTVEKYDLNKTEEKAAFEKKYGELPPIPPRPPIPVKLPDFVTRIDRNAELVEIWLKDGTKDSYNLKVPSEKAAFENKYGALLPVQDGSFDPPANGYELSAAQEVNRANIGEHFEINDNKASVRLKNGKVEEYNLASDAERKKFETKYGKIIEVDASVEGISKPVTVITGYSLNKNVSNEPVTVTGYSHNKNVSNEPITVTGYSHNKSVSNEPITVTGYSHNKNVSNEPITVTGYPLNKNVNNEMVTAISPEGSRTLITPKRIAGEGGVTFLNNEGNLIRGQEEILVTITKKTTQQQLEGFVKQMKERDIQLKFDNADYDNGILVHIDGTMKFKDRQGNFLATDFNKLILSTIKDGDHIYIQVRIADNKVVM